MDTKKALLLIKEIEDLMAAKNDKSLVKAENAINKHSDTIESLKKKISDLEKSLKKGFADPKKEPKEEKIKRIQRAVDSKEYKPDPKKIAEKVIQSGDLEKTDPKTGLPGTFLDKAKKGPMDSLAGGAGRNKYQDQSEKQSGINLPHAAHSALSHKDVGTSQAGEYVKDRYNDKPTFSGADHPAKKIHKKILDKLKSMPKPNLPKSEDLDKGFKVPAGGMKDAPNKIMISGGSGQKPPATPSTVKVGGGNGSTKGFGAEMPKAPSIKPALKSEVVSKLKKCFKKEPKKE